LNPEVIGAGDEVYYVPLAAAEGRRVRHPCAMHLAFDGVLVSRATCSPTTWGWLLCRPCWRRRWTSSCLPTR
jgi:hypothetical protein